MECEHAAVRAVKVPTVMAPVGVTSGQDNWLFQHCECYLQRPWISVCLPNPW